MLAKKRLPALTIFILSTTALASVNQSAIDLQLRTQSSTTLRCDGKSVSISKNNLYVDGQGPYAYRAFPVHGSSSITISLFAPNPELDGKLDMAGQLACVGSDD